MDGFKAFMIFHRLEEIAMDIYDEDEEFKDKIFALAHEFYKKHESDIEYEFDWFIK